MLWFPRREETMETAPNNHRFRVYFSQVNLNEWYDGYPFFPYCSS